MNYRLYIGSNNITGKVEKSKAVKIIANNHKGFTILPEAEGYWNGKPEKTLLIEIETEDRAGLMDTIKTLAKELHQEAIGLLAISKMDFIGA